MALKAVLLPLNQPIEDFALIMFNNPVIHLLVRCYENASQKLYTNECFEWMNKRDGNCTKTKCKYAREKSSMISIVLASIFRM